MFIGNVPIAPIIDGGDTANHMPPPMVVGVMLTVVPGGELVVTVRVCVWGLVTPAGILKVSELVERLRVWPSKPLASNGTSKAARSRPENRCTIRTSGLV